MSKTTPADVETPLMKQYMGIKHKHPDAILLFRVGDFYETFGEDAVKTSSILGITLTRRANGAASYVELAGFPFHALDTYLPKLVRAGQRVAICEQLEDPKMTKKIVKRGITELITPGVSMHDNVLEHKENNFLACVHFGRQIIGAAFLDISTGEFFAGEGNAEYIDKLLNSYKPKEVLVERRFHQTFTETFGTRFYLYKLDDWAFTEESANDRLLRQFQVNSLKGYGVQGIQHGIVAAGAILVYLEITEHHQTTHISKLVRIEEGQHLWLDRFTIRNLELTGSANEGAMTLLDVIDRTITPMGARLLRRWLLFPLRNLSRINDRLNVVEHFYLNDEAASQLSRELSHIGDLERLSSKISVGRINPRETFQLQRSLAAIPRITELLRDNKVDALHRLAEQLNPCQSICDRIARELHPDPPVAINKGSVIANGISSELDDLRQLSLSGKDYLLAIQQRELERTGISSLKISYNNVFGYYIEVRNTHKDKVPADWIRKQTLVNAERYITEELKEYETKILGAEEKILTLETSLFNQLIADLADFIPAIQLNASLLARLDCLLGFARVAHDNNYVRPEITESETLDIRQGRHPVIERRLPAGDQYVANDVALNHTDQQIIVITGPNMSGKSALLRQTGLIVILAQCGSFVPAKSASIGIMDKLFTRVGASDNISQGESTFMVEMNEAASILNNISDRSLVLLDEIGRGTSTYDGISIAWAMAEYIHEYPAAKAKTLFATHYHELNEMESHFRRIRNFNVSVKETADKVIFLRKLVPGGSEHSFGIHVARMAGMPRSVVKRAEEILAELEKSHQAHNLTKPVGNIAEHREGYQLSIFQLEDPVLKQIRDQIRSLDINNLTPVEALNKLNEIKKISGL